MRTASELNFSFFASLALAVPNGGRTDEPELPNKLYVSPQAVSRSSFVVRYVLGGGFKPVEAGKDSRSKLARIPGLLLGTQNSTAFEVLRH